MAVNMEQLVEQFGTYEKEMKKVLDKQDEEMRTLGTTTKETRDRVVASDSILVDLGSRIDKARNESQEVQDALGKAQERIVQLENLSAQPRRHGARAKSFGQLFVESDEFKRAAAQNLGTTDPFKIDGSFLGYPRSELSSTAAEGGALIEPERLPGIIFAPERPPIVRDLLDVQPTTNPSIQYVEETGFTNAAATVAEKGTKPESNISFALRTMTVETVAHWILSTRQILADATQLRAHVDTRLRYGVRIAEEAQVIYGSGTSPDLQGIATNANINTYVQGADAAGETKIDAIRRGILRARRAEYPVNGMVMHPDDFAEIELLKDNTGRYIWVTVTDGGVMRLWRVPVVESTAIDVGDVLMGAFSLGATLWDREQTMIRVSEHHAQVFITNQVVILAEERVGLAIYRPEAFTLVTLDSASGWA